MPEALDDSEYRRLLQFRTALRRFLHWSGQQAEAVGLTAAQHQLLLAIRGHDDERGPTIGEVAGYLLLRHHSAVGLVDRAEEAGLVERVEDAKDRRVVRLRLTSHGEETLRSLSAAHLRELERLAPHIRILLTLDDGEGRSGV
ncbi:MAG TPA: MarR family transcriptional regulator [Thermoanaerobaculia bacterium]|nr:MarR family transcriptional regulator [Thermoanaerobaculia bacterium]